MIFSLIFGLLLALMRISKRRFVSVPAGIWVDVWRNLPLILIILYLALAVPTSWREAYSDLIPGWFPEALQDELVLGALLGLVLYNSAVLCEIMRSGIQSLDRGQHEAAASLGLTYTQQMRLVILPQGLRRMVPATVSQLITLNKDTTLVSDHRDPGGDRAGRQHHQRLRVLRRGAGAGPSGLPRRGRAVHLRQPGSLEALAQARDPRA